MQASAIINFCQDAEPVADYMIIAGVQFGINTPLRWRHFLAQCAHESGGFKRYKEGLNYSVEALLAKFGRHRISEADAHKYGRSAQHAAGQQAIGNIIYGGEFGKKQLGNIQPTDGYVFRGGGLIQLTGRANYANASKAIWHDDRLVLNPDLIRVAGIESAMAACWFFESHGCLIAADANNLKEVRRLVNGGSIGLAECHEWLERAEQTIN